jgi:hypothetical protein
MTSAQKKNIVRFKAVQAEAKRLKAKNKNLKHYAAVKQAWAILYNTDKKKKVGATKKKSATKKKTATKKYVQRGTSNKKLDKLKQALTPGVRLSKKTGKKYTETRANRSDKGKLLGVNKSKKYSITINTIDGHVVYGSAEKLTEAKKIFLLAQKIKSLDLLKKGNDYVIIDLYNNSTYKIIQEKILTNKNFKQ